MHIKKGIVDQRSTINPLLPSITKNIEIHNNKILVTSKILFFFRDFKNKLIIKPNFPKEEIIPKLAKFPLNS